MAITPKNAKAAMTTSSTTAYTVPTSTNAIIKSIQVTNIDGTNTADASISWTDSSDSDTETFLIKSTTVQPGEATSALVDVLHLEAGDTIKVLASANSDLVCSISLLEIT